MIAKFYRTVLCWFTQHRPREQFVMAAFPFAYYRCRRCHAQFTGA